MADEQLEARVRELTEQVQALTSSLEHLSGRKGEQQRRAHRPAEESTFDAEPEISEEIITWAGKTSLLPRLSTLCFLLVVALALRTITDNNIINTLMGSGLGMGYAALLVATGWYLYGKGSPLAPVFSACGAILMATVVVETHTRFQSLPLVPAYLTLMATGAAMALTSYRFNAFVPISLGTLGLCLAGAAIDYPNPFYPYLVMVLWTANVLGYFAARLKRCSWLRWIVLATTMLMLYQWGIKLGMALYRKTPPLPSLALRWFLPALAVFAATFTLLALLGVLRDRQEQPTRFDCALPTIASLLLYGAASYVVRAWEGSSFVLGGAGIGSALILLGVAIWLASSSTSDRSGANVFVFAGASLLAIALPGASGHYLMALPVLGVAAFFLTLLSRHWNNGGVRFTTYLMAVYACSALALLAKGAPAAADFLTVIPATLLAVTTLYHYQWSRRWPPPAESGFFSRIDPHDRSAVLLLLGALLSGFIALRSLVYQIIAMTTADLPNAFRCAQSVIIAASAAGLILYAVHRRNREVRNVAILVTLIAAIKVFLYDMLGAHGVPLVLSLLAFGLAAAVDSVVLGRWPRKTDEEPEKVAGLAAPPRHA